MPMSAKQSEDMFRSQVAHWYSRGKNARDTHQLAKNAVEFAQGLARIVDDEENQYTSKQIADAQEFLMAVYGVDY